MINSTADAKSTGSIGTIKNLRIHLQLSQILELRLFGIRLETKVGAN